MTGRASRWQRLADALTAAGVVGVKVDTYGAGADPSYSIALRLPEGAGLVEVHDKWGRGRASDVWAGYQVHTENRESIETAHWPLTKQPAEVVEAVVTALRRAAARMAD